MCCAGTSSIGGAFSLKGAPRSRAKPSRPFSRIEMEFPPLARCVAGRSERSDDGVSAPKVQGFRGRHHSFHGRAKQGEGRNCMDSSEVDKRRGGREGLDAVVHGRETREG